MDCDDRCHHVESKKCVDTSTASKSVQPVANFFATKQKETSEPSAEEITHVEKTMAELLTELNQPFTTVDKWGRLWYAAEEWCQFDGRN